MQACLCHQLRLSTPASTGQWCCPIQSYPILLPSVGRRKSKANEKGVHAKVEKMPDLQNGRAAVYSVLCNVMGEQAITSHIHLERTPCLNTVPNELT